MERDEIASRQSNRLYEHAWFTWFNLPTAVAAEPISETGRFHLWADVIVGDKRRIVGNWKD